MSTRTELLKQMIADGSYPIDEDAIAKAIVVRATARRVLPDLAFRCSEKQVRQQVRSFRPHRGARSFRLARADRRSAGHAALVAA